jgi:hypothetical protein
MMRGPMRSNKAKIGFRALKSRLRSIQRRRSRHGNAEEYRDRSDGNDAG